MCYNMHMNAQHNARRAKGTGSLRRRGNFWYARWTHDGLTTTLSTGIRVGETRGGKSDRELAEAWLLDQTEALRLRHRVDALAFVKRQLQTVEERIADGIESARHYMTAGEMSGAFRRSPRRPDCGAEMVEFYCGVLDRFAAWIGADTEVRAVGDDDAERYATSLGARSAGTFNKAMNALSLAWRVLGPSAGLSDGTDPWKGIARKRTDAHVRRPLTRDETDALLAAADGEMRTLVAVCLYTGLRLGDACQFRWEDIRDGAAYVLTSKRDRRVAIPIHPALRNILGERRAGGFIMPGMAARYRDAKQGRSNVSRSVMRLFRRCGIETSVKAVNGRLRPDATAHSLRHTFVTRAVEAGVPPHVVQAIVGHSSAVMTERYTHLSDEAVLRAFENMK